MIKISIKHDEWLFSLTPKRPIKFVIFDGSIYRSLTNPSQLGNSFLSQELFFIVIQKDHIMECIDIFFGNILRKLKTVRMIHPIGYIAYKSLSSKGHYRS